MISYVNKYMPSVYHDPREVMYKHIIAQVYWSIFEKIIEKKIETSCFNSQRFTFIKFFNSQHDLDKLIKSFSSFSNNIVQQLNQIGEPSLAKEIGLEILEAHNLLNELSKLLSGLRHVDRTQSYVADGIISIAGKGMEDYASNPEYINACLELIGADSEEIVKLATESWRLGFTVDNHFRNEVLQTLTQYPSATDLITYVLMREQQQGKYKSLQEYEYSTELSFADNLGRKKQAICEGFFLMGKIMAAISLMNTDFSVLPHDEIMRMDPVSAFLKQAGFKTTMAQKNIIQSIMLVRSSHGLSPGEFAARVAASVRTSFPRSLVNSIMVRTGKSHGGAVSYCMQQQDDYMEAVSKEAFTNVLLQSGNLSGFGHRIHKLKSIDPDIVKGADPRVSFMMKQIRIGFPDKREIIDDLENFARLIQKQKPNLSPNTDFIAGILFHCLDISSEAGLGFFITTRLPGLISEVINQLDYKANSLRPPLAVTIPYIL